MTKVPVRLVYNNSDFGRRWLLLKKQDLCQRYPYSILNRFQRSKADGDGLSSSRCEGMLGNIVANNYSSSEDELSGCGDRWKPEIAWLGKALEPALQLYKWALPRGDVIEHQPPPTDRSLSEIFASIQRSKLGIQEWSLGDLTIGLYLLYLRQASTSCLEDVKGETISSESIVQDLIYHTELAKGAYKDNAAGLARNSMVREQHVIKFVKNSSVLRPGYYIAIDMRKKLVILGVRGTHTVYDLITDIVSSGHEEITAEGYSTHFGTAEAARWFLNHEMDTIRKCLDKHKGFRLRLVGHSLGGATASLLAIKLRKKSMKELGFSPDIMSAVGYATPPCVSKELAENCSDFVTTVIMQDDIVPRLSVSSLRRLRNEIVETDWESVFRRDDWKGVLDLVSNARQIVSSVQDVARKLAEYTKSRGQSKHAEIPPTKREIPISTSSLTRSEKRAAVDAATEDLFVPGTLYYLKRNADSSDKHMEHFTLLRRNPGEHFRRILLSSNLLSDHKCDSHYYALRDVLKGLPSPLDDPIVDR